MRPVLVALAGVSLVAISSAASAQPSAPAPATAPAEPAKPASATKRPQEPLPPTVEEDLPKRTDRPASDGFLDRFVLETGRVSPLPLDPDFLIFSLHGEYELRFRALTDLPLEPPLRGALPTEDGSAPEDPALLGQNKYLYHWLRLWGRVVFREDFALVGQIDIPRGLVAGDTTQFVDRSRDPLATYNWYDVHPREFYVEYRSPIGLFRLGQQTSYWGMGILANDGDHPQMFGDTIRGALVERLLFATTPMGRDTPLLIAVAGDFVFEDNTADVLGNSPEQPTGDLAGQAVLALAWREDFADIGIYGVYRHQEREMVAVLEPYDESLDVGVIDVAGRLRGRVPGTDGYAYIQAEAATVFGRTSYVRSSYVNRLDPGAEVQDESILSFGAAANLGFVHVRSNDKDRWGDVVTEVEWGYASGDADPFDGETRRFTFDTNRNVGLVLFDHVLGWKTARSATIAQDPRVTNRPNPGLQFLPSNGGVFGATYVNPRFLFRPIREVDVKLGLVFAQATADVVDPYRAGALGDYQNFDGGDPRSRDLGVEIDTGVDGRIPLERTVTLELGAEGGVLFPGHAFDDGDGTGLPEQMVLNTKLGLQF
jgi:hypothetical protein